MVVDAGFVARRDNGVQKLPSLLVSEERDDKFTAADKRQKDI